MSFAHLLCPEFDLGPGCTRPKAPGAMIELEPNGRPALRIVTVDGERASVRRARRDSPVQEVEGHRLVEIIPWGGGGAGRTRHTDDHNLA